MLAGWLILPGRGLSAANGYLPMSLGNAADLRAACGSVLYLTLIALLAFGVTAALRDSAAGIGVVLGVLLLSCRSSPRHTRPRARPSPGSSSPR